MFAFLLSWHISLCLFAADIKPSANPDLVRLRATYETELQKIIDAELTVLGALQDGHVDSMKALQKKMQEAGNLEALLATGKEIERFKVEKKIGKADLSGNVPELFQLQNRYIKSIDRLPLDKAKKIMTLVQSYDKSMSSLQEVFTRKNDINVAMEIRNEREAVKQRAEVTSASFLLADTESMKKDEPKQPEKSIEKPMVKEPEHAAGDAAVKKPDLPAKKKYTGSAEKRIRQRFDELCKSILKQDFAKASELVNPKIVKLAGAQRIQAGISEIFPFIQATTDPHLKLSVDSVKLSEDGQTATLIPRLWVVSQWRSMQASKWAEIDGEWYLDFPDNGGIEPQREQRFDEFETRRAIREKRMKKILR
ncbi:MAG: hypothetical protein PHI84_20400 [Kiritimatiellae bacterium]|nr:hypothetical protein [Kiritimatiellia bacterium]